MSKRKSLSTTERIRLFKLHKGVCHICKLKIDGTRDKWEIEHIIPVGIKGEEAETDQNRQPAHAKCHKTKTAQDKKDIAQCKHREAYHIGAKRPSRNPIPGSKASGWKHKMNGTWEKRT